MQAPGALSFFKKTLFPPFCFCHNSNLLCSALSGLFLICAAAGVAGLAASTVYSPPAGNAPDGEREVSSVFDTLGLTEITLNANGSARPLARAGPRRACRA